MKKNFFVKSSVELECAGRTYDLHSNFDLSCILFDPLANSLKISWVSVGGGKDVEFTFKSIDSLMLKGVDEEMPRTEDRRLSFMGYVHPEDVDLMDGFLPEDLAAENFSLIFSFEGGIAVKVRCGSAEFKECAV